MNLDADELLARIRQAWPTEYRVIELELLVEKQIAEIDRLTALQSGTTYSASAVRPYVGDGTAVDLGPRHG